MGPAALIISSLVAAGLTAEQAYQAYLNYKGQAAQLGFQEKSTSMQKQGMGQYLDYLKNSSDTDFNRAVSMKREDRANDRQNMLMAMLMQSNQNQTQTMMGMMQALSQANQVPQAQNYGPPSSLTSLLR